MLIFFYFILIILSIALYKVKAGQTCLPQQYKITELQQELQKAYTR